MPELEWSGVLFYRILEGDIDNPDGLKMIADAVYPMDIGEPAYTSFEYNDPSLVGFMIQNGYIDHRQGLIHSHNKMRTFFSSTDNDEVAENAKNFNFYLSLIVNNWMETTAGIGVYNKVSKHITGTRSHRKSNGVWVQEKLDYMSDTEVVDFYNVDTEREANEILVPHITERIPFLLKKKEERAKAKAASKSSNNGSGGSSFNVWSGKPGNLFDFEEPVTTHITMSTYQKNRFMARWIEGDPLYDGKLDEAIEGFIDFVQTDEHTFEQIKDNQIDMYYQMAEQSFGSNVNDGSHRGLLYYMSDKLGNEYDKLQPGEEIPEGLLVLTEAVNYLKDQHGAK